MAKKERVWRALALAGMIGLAHAQSEHTGPDDLVRNSVDSVMRAAHDDHAGAAGDIAALERIVEQKFLPATDFEHTARMAVGEAWQNASPEQRKELFLQFQRLIVRVYATQLTQISERQLAIKVRPTAFAPGISDVVVRTVVQDNGEDNEISYRLEKGAAGWRIYDINILGSWLSQLYRNQFAPQLAAGGVNGLIHALAQRNSN